KQGKHDDAIAEFKNAINKGCEFNAEASADADVCYCFGLAYQNLGMHDKAIKCLEKAIDLNPEYAEAYNNLGIAFLKQGNHDEAIKCLEKAIDLNPDLEKAIDPRFADVYNKRASVKLDNKNYEGAITDLEKAIYVNSDLAQELIPKLADASKEAERKGDKNEALDYKIKALDYKIMEFENYKEAIRIDPEIEWDYFKKNVWEDLMEIKGNRANKERKKDLIMRYEKIMCSPEIFMSNSGLEIEKSKRKKYKVKNIRDYLKKLHNYIQTQVDKYRKATEGENQVNTNDFSEYLGMDSVNGKISKFLKKDNVKVYNNIRDEIVNGLLSTPFVNKPAASFLNDGIEGYFREFIGFIKKEGNDTAKRNRELENYANNFIDHFGNNLPNELLDDWEKAKGESSEVEPSVQNLVVNVKEENGQVVVGNLVGKGKEEPQPESVEEAKGESSEVEPSVEEANGQSSSLNPLVVEQHTYIPPKWETVEVENNN
ncbi:MAG: tetratricopeptide repeat protein, partial [Desulfobacteraceae bacterium]|nr:tetratricopeptide repeat protein [Desulfobacteraceae bacterium]